MNDNATRRRAALPGCANGAEYDRRNSEVEIGIFVNNDRVVAAQFEQALAQAIRELLANPTANPGLASE